MARVAPPLLVAALLAGCASTTGAASSPTSTTSPPAGRLELGSVSTAGWIPHVARGGGVVMTIRTPPTWTHAYPPGRGGPFGATTLSDFAIPRACAPSDTAGRCRLGYGGRLVPPRGSMLSVTFDTPSSPTIPDPYAVEEGGVTTNVDGFPAIATVRKDVACTSLGSPLTFFYEVELWVPAGATLDFCVNGPDLARQEAVAATIASSVTVRADPSSAAAPVAMSGATTTTGGFAPSSKVPYCTSAQLAPTIAASARGHDGRTTIDVTTTFDPATRATCGLPPLSSCGSYGDFVVDGPTGRALWTWAPLMLGVQCLGGVWRLPITLEVPSWSVPTRLLAKGTYAVRMGSVVNGAVRGPVLASTTFDVR